MRFLRKHLNLALLLVTFAATYLSLFPVFKLDSLTAVERRDLLIVSAVYLSFYLLVYLTFLYCRSAKKTGESKVSRAEIMDEVPEPAPRRVVVHAQPQTLEAIHRLRSSDKEVRSGAVDLLVRAVELEDRRAALLLGLLYERGIVVPKSAAKALEIYNIALELGSKNAYLLKAKMFEGTEENVSFYNARLAAKAGVPEALNYLGNKYFAVSAPLAGSFYDLAIDRGSTVAAANHALLSARSGRILEADKYRRKVSKCDA